MKRRAPTIRRCEALQRALKKSLLNVLSNARFNAELRQWRAAMVATIALRELFGGQQH